MKGICIEIAMDEVLLKSPMKLLIADGKVAAVERGCRGCVVVVRSKRYT